jgi:fumarate reductase subunit D
MRIYTIFERAFVSLIGALMLWSASHWVTDGLQLWRSHEPGAIGFMSLAVGMVLVASLFLFVGVRGRGPRWANRSSLTRNRQ